MEDARRVARDRARQLAERVAAGLAEKCPYGYPDRPLPEPVLKEFGNGSGTRAAVITRNLYGALVLNTRDLMFIDIDRQVARGELEKLARQNRLSTRIYRTAAGYRVLVTNTNFEAGSSASEKLLSQFGADPLYTRLCRAQQSFRARLTPKPWRCGMRAPGVSFPFATSAETARFDKWATEYALASQAYATCQFVQSCGDGTTVPAFTELIAHHDSATKVQSALPLA
jgi:hypothetical protein